MYLVSKKSKYFQSRERMLLHQREVHSALCLQLKNKKLLCFVYDISRR